MDPETNTPPANAAERQAAVEAAKKAGDFDAAINAAAEKRDWNLHASLEHAKLSREADVAIDEHARLAGELAKAKAKLERIGDPLKRSEAEANLRELQGQLRDAERKAEDLSQRARQRPLIARRAQGDDLSDAATFRAFVEIEDGPFRRFAPISDGSHRGLNATINHLVEQGLDPSCRVMLVSSQGWRYSLALDEMGRLHPRLLLPNGHEAALAVVEGDGVGPQPVGQSPIGARAEDFYSGRKLAVADLRTDEERFDAGLGIKPARALSMHAMLRRALGSGVKIVRRP